MRKLLKFLGITIGVLLIGAIAFYLVFLRGLSRPEIALQPIKFVGTEMPGHHDCLWMGPVTIDAFNTAYPDGGAIYWPTVFQFPVEEQGSYLEITGIYPKARYMSLHSYTEGAKPYDYLNDINIVASEGSQNPFLTGRYEQRQSYTLKLFPGERPTDAGKNELYLGPLDKVSSTPLILRNYVPETLNDPSGGAGLPQVTLVRENGERISGVQLCKLLKSPQIGDPNRFVAAPVIPRKDYDQMIQNREVHNSIVTAKQEDWTVFWDPRISVTRLMSPALTGMLKTMARWGIIKKTSGFFANFDNEYVSMYINEAFGNVTVLRGRLPLTPETGSAGGDASAYDMRYWSLCTNEGLATTRFTDCKYDSQVTIDDNRNYTIVISKPENRPVNASKECGVTWINFGKAGDGAGNETISILILRNMLPNPEFAHSVQKIQRVGDEKTTMEVYLPIPKYTDKESFESFGCSAK